MQHGCAEPVPRTRVEVAAFLSGLAILLCPIAAFGKGKHPGTSGALSCAAAWRAAVAHQTAGELKDAKALFAQCRRTVCLPAVREECGKQYTQTESDVRSGTGAGAPADASNQSCGSAWQSAVDRQKSGHLMEARELFGACRQTSCAPGIRRACITKYEELEADIPSVVALCADSAGQPQTDIEIKVDGQPLASQLDGRSVAVDPGMHEFSFIKDGDVFASQQIMIAEGQHNRLISAALPGVGRSMRGEGRKVSKPAASLKPAALQGKATLAANQPAAPVADETHDDSDGSNDGDAAVTKTAESGRHIPVLTYALAGVGVAGLGGFGLLTYWGRKDANILVGCTPTCQPSSVDHVHRLYLAADIAAGVGVAALAGAYWAYARHSSGSHEEESAKETTAYMFGVAPTATGAVGTISGTF